MTIRAWKLVTQRKDGTLGPLFINKRLVMVPGVWMDAEAHPTKGFAFRPGWHATPHMRAPHLSGRGRVWVRVELDGVSHIKRPESQGGYWYLAKRMRVLYTSKKRGVTLK